MGMIRSATLSTVLLLSSISSCERPKEVVDPTFTADCAGPVSVTEVIDQSGSMETSSTASVESKDLLPLLDRIQQCGGELNVLFVREAPERGATRIEFSEPPSSVPRPKQQEDETDYDFTDRILKYKSEMMAREKQIEEMARKGKGSIKDFVNTIDKKLRRKEAAETDLFSALNSSEILSRTAKVRWKGRAQLYTIVVSDGLDTRGRSRLFDNSVSNLFWVNTTSKKSDLGSGDVRRFENHPAAVNEVLQRTEIKERSGK
ncbi:MAG: hypothetical protein J5I65_02160 [Aridibacter famidurans]|nr:hypothetical protein [Aridibacter famidurans]